MGFLIICYAYYNENIFIIFTRKIFNCDLQKVTFQKAQEHSVKTARLPIQEYMVRCQNRKNYHSEILAINQGTAYMAYTFFFF